MHFCKCGRHDHTAYVGWFRTTRFTSVLRRQLVKADHTSITTRTRPGEGKAPWILMPWRMVSSEQTRKAASATPPMLLVLLSWCAVSGATMTQINACNQLPGSFSRASSCYIFITIMVQVASRIWPYPQHLRNRRRCVEEWRSSTPDVPAVPLWNSMDTLSFIFKQWWLSIEVRTNRSYQTFLTDWNWKLNYWTSGRGCDLTLKICWRGIPTMFQIFYSLHSG